MPEPGDRPEARSIPDGWKCRPLDDLLQREGLSYGIVQPGSEDPNGVPILRVNNLRGGTILTEEVLRVSPRVEEKYRRTRLEGGEVVLSVVGSIGEVAIVPPQLAGWNVARAVAVIRTTDVSSQWVRLCLSSEPAISSMHMWKTTTVQETLNLRDIRRLPILLPPKHERTAIVAVIGALDDKIAANDRMACTAFDLAGGIYQQAASRATLSAVVSDVLDLKYGKSLPAATRVDGDVPVYGSGGITGSHNEALAQGPGVVVGRKGTVGTVYWAEDKFFTIDTAFYVSLRREVPMEFAFFMLRGLGLDAMNSDSAVPGLSRSNVLALPVLVPDQDDIRAFHTAVRPIFALRDGLAAQSAALAKLRAALLPRLMSGEIRLRDAEKLVEDTT